MTGNTWFFLITGILTSGSLITLIIFLIINFLRKRTLGTLLLVFAYADSTIADLILTITIWYQAFGAGEPTRISVLVPMLTGIVLMIHSILFMYFFGNRILLGDNDLVKALYVSGFLLLMGISIGLAYEDLLLGITNSQWFDIIELSGSNLIFVFPPALPPAGIITILFTVIGVWTYVRIGIKALQIRGRTDEVVKKKGLTLVAVSIISFLITGLILGAYYFVAGIPILEGAVFALRGIFTVVAFICGYLGWLMPDWLVRRFRGQTWVAKVYTGKIPKPKGDSSEFTESSEYNQSTTEIDSTKVVEISEK